MPAGTDVPKEMMSWQHEVLSRPPGYQSRYWLILGFNFMSAGKYCVYLSLNTVA
jgi:hypothetical protein